MYKDLLRDAKEMQQTLLDLRRTLHQIPEVGLELPETTKVIKAELERLGIPYEILKGSSSITASIGEGEHCILLRADVDGLPIEEKSGVPFAATNGCMHACGHDMHAASLLGAAALLKAREKQLGGRAVLLFQTGEETYNGAFRALSDGLLEDSGAEAAFSLRVMPQLPLNYILYGDNPMASVYGFKITVIGKGGYGTAPEACIDPINTGVHIYLALQELIARECPPSKEAVLTVGEFSAGNASNILPDTAVLQGTLRTFDEKTKQQLIRRIGEVVKGVAAGYRTEAVVEELADVPVLSCNRKMSEEIVRDVRQMNREFNVWEKFHVMSSEDFAYIARRVPSAYFAVGAAAENCDRGFGRHNPRVVFNEDALPTAAAVYACAAQGWLARRSRAVESFSIYRKDGGICVTGR